jgi:hypothetical protein
VKIKPDLECNCGGKNSIVIKTKSGFLFKLKSKLDFEGYKITNLSSKNLL